MNKRTLAINVLEAWSAGSGKAEGAFLDAVPALDADGLPYLPGRTLKGLLREAILRLEEAGGCDAGSASKLFGTRSSGQDRYTTSPGLMRVDSARLPLAVRTHLQQHTKLKAGLFHDVFQTAIDDTTGVARSRSLRSARLAVPMTLWANIVALKPVTAEQWAALEASLAWLDGVGNGRTRGLGRCVAGFVVSTVEKQGASNHG